MVRKVKRMKNNKSIELLVQYPSTEQGKRELSRLAAQIQADFVMNYIDGMDCPAEQKTQLLQAVIDQSCKMLEDEQKK